MLGRTSYSSLLLFSFVLAGCVQGAPPEDGPAGQSEQPIINGQKDTTHDAVVAVLGNQSACTGTIIHKDVAAKRGYVLTAAHCVEDPPQVVVRGTNYLNGTQYPVVGYLAHSSYNGEVYDFAMVTFSWSQAEPPVIPAMTGAQDTLAAGSNVKFLGYGVTENSNNNSTRYYFDGKIQQVKALTFSYNQSNSGPNANNGGPCFGDSGGPALFVVPGVGEVVAGVTSYGDQNCNQYGVSGRVSAIGPWISNYIMNGGGGGGQTCDQCAQEATSAGGACIGPVNSCFNNTQCASFVECLDACQTQTCVDQCVQSYPNGVNGYLAILSCLCDTGCQSECGGEPFCQGGGNEGCGFTAEDPQCLSCFEGNCCAQGSACAADQACADCLTGANPDPSCLDQNVKAAQFYQCLAQKCGTECGIQGGGGSGAGGSGSGAGGSGSGAGGGVGGGGVGAGNVGGGGVGAGDVGGGDGDGGGDGGGDNNGDGGGTTVASCTCRAAAGDAPSGDVAIAFGAALAGLLASRRKRRS